MRSRREKHAHGDIRAGSTGSRDVVGVLGLDADGVSALERGLGGNSLGSLVGRGKLADGEAAGARALDADKAESSENLEQLGVCSTISIDINQPRQTTHPQVRGAGGR